MKLLVQCLSRTLATQIPTGKYLRWADRFSVDSFCELLGAVAAFNAAVFPSTGERSVFPVIEAPVLGSALRVQLSLEALCMLCEFRQPENAERPVAEKLAGLERLGAPLGSPPDDLSDQPACSTDLREHLAAAAPTACLATMNEWECWALLWSLGEIHARLLGSLREVRVIGSKRSGEPASPLLFVLDGLRIDRACKLSSRLRELRPGSAEEFSKPHREDIERAAAALFRAISNPIARSAPSEDKTPSGAQVSPPPPSSTPGPPSS